MQEKIRRYLSNLPSALLEVKDSDAIEILEMTSGSYNLNYHVRVDQKDFIFRINIEQQSGLANQIEYEFGVLKFLEGHAIAPKAYHFDDRRKHFDFDILIEEYLAGPSLSLVKADLPEVAELLARLHALDPRGMPSLVRRKPLAGIDALARSDLAGYAAKKSSDKKTIRLAKKTLAKAEMLIGKHQDLFQPDSLNHTDLCCENFIKTAQGLRLIDWEKPLVDDGTYDICCFLSAPVELYNSENILDPEDRLYFIERYARLRGKNPDDLVQKVRLTDPLLSLHWILWAATMLSNFREQHTSPELMEAHAEKIARYERVADPQNIERLLEALQSNSATIL